MERVETLYNLLKEKMQNKAGVQDLLVTVQLLQSELEHLQRITPGVTGASANTASLKIAKPPQTNNNSASDSIEETSTEKTVEVLQIDEAEVEAELEEIKKSVSERNHISFKSKPGISYNPLEDIPTLYGRKTSGDEAGENIKTADIHQLNPVNNLAQQDELSQKPLPFPQENINNGPVKDLKKAITPDERALYINELFRGDEAMYERSIKTINGFGIFGEAEYWVRRELKLKLGWEPKNKTVLQFDHLIRRRFD